MLAATQNFFLIKFLVFRFLILLMLIEFINFIFPQKKTFFAPSMCKNFLVSELDVKHRSKESNILFEKFEKIFHFLYVFFVILALIKINLIFFFLILKIKFGQISESTKKIMLGFHDDKNFFTRKSTSKGKKR